MGSQVWTSKTGVSKSPSPITAMYHLHYDHYLYAPHKKQTSLFHMDFKIPLFSGMMDARLFIVMVVVLAVWECEMQQLLQLPIWSLAKRSNWLSAELVSPVELFRAQRSTQYMGWEMKGTHCSMVGKVKQEGQGITDGFCEMDYWEWED